MLQGDCHRIQTFLIPRQQRQIMMVESGFDNLVGKDNRQQNSLSPAEVQEISKSTLAPIYNRIDAIEFNFEKLETLLNSNVLLLQAIQTEVISTKLSVLHLTENVLKDAVSRVEKNSSSAKKGQDTGDKININKAIKIIDGLFPDAFIKDHPIISTILTNPNSTYRNLREVYPNIPIPPGLKETDHIEGSEEKLAPTLKEYSGKYTGISKNHKPASNNQNTGVRVREETAYQMIKSVFVAVVEYIGAQIEQFDTKTLAAIFIALCSTILFLVFTYLNAKNSYEQQQQLNKRRPITQSIFDIIKFW